MDSNTVTSTATKTEIGLGSRVGTGLVLGLGVAFLASYLMAGMFFFQNGQKSLVRNTVTTPIRPIPFLADDISSARLNTEVDANGGIINMGFDRLGVSLGYIDTYTNTYHDQTNVSGGHDPLAIGFSLDHEGEKTFPARVVAMTAFVNGNATDYTLCVPETVVSFDNTMPSYYYDVNGTPYTDSLLTKPATSAPCNQLLANTLRIDDISSARLNTEVDANGGIINMGFDRLGVSLGYIDTYTNTYHDQTNVSGGHDPLAIGFSLDHEGEKTFPARVVAMTAFVNGNATDYTLCVPETVVSFDNTMPSYYYDVNGTPYTDSFLTQRASCSTGGSSPSVLKTPALPIEPTR